MVTASIRAQLAAEEGIHFRLGTAGRRHVEMEETKVDVVEASPPPPMSRRTRSQAAPGWTAQEMLTLANEVAAVEEDCRRALSSYQRWTIVADNCSAILGGGPRSANQCRRRWDATVADHCRIRAWEEEAKASYWSLDDWGRRAAQLPADFDREVFAAVARSLRAQEHGAEAGDVVSESEEQGGPPGEGDDDDVIVAEAVSGSKKAMQTKSGQTTQRMQEMACRLQENAQHIHAILRGELSGDGARMDSPPVDLSKTSSAYTEFRRHQADELIKALGSLISGIDHFSELAEEHGRDGM